MLATAATLSIQRGLHIAVALKRLMNNTWLDRGDCEGTEDTEDANSEAEPEETNQPKVDIPERCQDVVAEADYFGQKHCDSNNERQLAHWKPVAKYDLLINRNCVAESNHKAPQHAEAVIAKLDS